MIGDALTPYVLVALSLYVKAFILAFVFFFPPIMFLFAFFQLTSREAVAGTAGD